MKVDLCQVLKTMTGKPIKHKLSEKEEVNMTLGMLCVEALLFESQEKINGEEKIKRFKLAKRIHQAKSVDLVSEETSLLKKLIGDTFNVLAVGQALEMIESKSPKP